MRVSVLHAPHDLRVEDRVVPEPAAHEVRVRVTAVGVCGSDVHYYEHGRIGSVVVEAPLVLGHEAGGVVDAVGGDVDDLAAGRRVSLEPGVPCTTCRQCLSGRYNLCPRMRFFATPPIDGAFAEFVVLPAAFVHPVPDALSDDAAALIEPLSVGVWACRRTQVQPGDTVLVTGAGPIGLLGALVARTSGADRVVVTDVSAARLSFAAGLGLETVDVSRVPVREADVAADVLLECSGNGHATADALESMAPAGRAVLIGAGPEELTVPLSAVQNKELQMMGAYRYAHTWPAAIALAVGGTIDLDAMVTGHFGLDDVAAALEAPARDPETIKVVVRPQD